MIEGSLNIGIQDPFSRTTRRREMENLHDGVMASPTRAKAITDPFKPRFQNGSKAFFTIA